MPAYAQIEDGRIYSIVPMALKEDGITEFVKEEMFAEFMWEKLINIDGIVPIPQPGWIYDGASFSEPPPPYVDPRPPILYELEQIDRASARPLRALIVADPDIGLGSPERAELEALEVRATELRAQLAALDEE